MCAPTPPSRSVVSITLLAASLVASRALAIEPPSAPRVLSPLPDAYVGRAAVFEWSIEPDDEVSVYSWYLVHADSGRCWAFIESAIFSHVRVFDLPNDGTRFHWWVCARNAAGSTCTEMITLVSGPEAASSSGVGTRRWLRR